MVLSIAELDVALIIPLDGLEKRLSETTLAQLEVVKVAESGVPERTPLEFESAVDVRPSRVTLARSLECVNDGSTQKVELVLRTEGVDGEELGVNATLLDWSEKVLTTAGSTVTCADAAKQAVSKARVITGERNADDGFM